MRNGGTDAQQSVKRQEEKQRDFIYLLNRTPAKVNKNKLVYQKTKACSVTTLVSTYGHGKLE